MVQETTEVNAEHETGTAFLDLLPDTSQKYLGLYNGANPADSKTRRCATCSWCGRTTTRWLQATGIAGCGEKSVLRSIAAVTEAYMRRSTSQERSFHCQSQRA